MPLSILLYGEWVLMVPLVRRCRVFDLIEYTSGAGSGVNAQACGHMADETVTRGVALDELVPQPLGKLGNATVGHAQAEGQRPWRQAPVEVL